MGVSTDFNVPGLGSADVVDNLTTADSSKPLSANQGKVLNDKIDQIDSLPVVSGSDNGKFLTVSNGVWTATTIQTWQGGSY